MNFAQPANGDRQDRHRAKTRAKGVAFWKVKAQ